MSDGKLLYFNEIKEEKEEDDNDYKLTEDDIELLPKDEDINNDVLKVKSEDGNEIKKEESIEGNLFIQKEIFWIILSRM